MAYDVVVVDPHSQLEVKLRNPPVAALLAWLWPGAGHFYQGRYGKGVLFMVCILCTYFFGLWLGGGHVVYASWKKTDRRISYIFQVFVGVPAFPAIVQNKLVMGSENRGPKRTLFGWDIMAPPEQPVKDKSNSAPNESNDQLARWHLDPRFHFDLGTLYTTVAGLLNLFVIYDAYAGPVFTSPEERKKEKKKRKRKQGEPPPEEDS